jgi:hypothetical protein
MVLNVFRCVRFGADILEVQLHFDGQNSWARWEGSLPYCHRVLHGANATARMRRVQDELCLSRAGTDNKRLLDAATGMVCPLLLNRAKAPGCFHGKTSLHFRECIWTYGIVYSGHNSWDVATNCALNCRFVRFRPYLNSLIDYLQLFQYTELLLFITTLRLQPVPPNVSYFSN